MDLPATNFALRREKAMSDMKRTRNIAFRVTNEEHERIEQTATGAGDDPNNWCRKAALSQLSEEHSFTKNERLIYKEIALLRFLIGHGFKLLFSRSETTAAAWKNLTTQADQHADEIVKEVLSRRK
jgi:hypothetical protein